MILYLHAGTHKTGTTFIQRFITGHRDLLEERGLYVPRSGLIVGPDGAAHHNIAWELGCHLTDADAGGLVDLVSELRECAPQNACISSEMFSTLYAKPEALERLRDAAASADAVIRPILYFRPQSDYLEALYAELVKHGLSRTFEDFLEEILNRGEIEYNEAMYGFAYDHMTAVFEKTFGRDVPIVLPYTNEGPPDAILRGFLERVCPAADDLDLAKLGAWERINLSIGFRGVAGSLVENRAKEGGSGLFEAVLEELIRDETWTPDELLKPNGLYWSGAFRPLGVDDLALLLSRFADGNRALGVRYNAEFPVYRLTRLFDQIRAAAGKRQAEGQA